MNVQTRSIIPVDIESLESIVRDQVNSTDLIWINQLSFSSVTVNGMTSICIYAPNTFCRDYVLSHNKDIINCVITEKYPFVKDIEYLVGVPNIVPTVNSNVCSDDVLSYDSDNSIKYVNENNINSRGLIDTYRFENFATDKLNELATVACRQISDVNIDTFNQIYIYGKSGTGKTHLLHAIGNRIVSLKPDAKVLYMTAEKFMYLFIKHSKDKNLIDFKDDLRSAYCLIVDDIHFLSGREATENEFFHTINELKQMNKKIVLSGNDSPFLINGLSKTLSTEIASNLTIEIPSFDSALRKKIIEVKLKSYDMKLPDNVIEFLSLKQLNAKQIDGAIKRIFMYSSLTNIDLTISKVTSLLSDLFYTLDVGISYTVNDIKKCVCDFFGISIVKMDSSVKEKNIALPRQIAMYLSKKFTNKTFGEIGRLFGGKEHATVIYAVKKVENLMNGDINFSQQIETIQNMFKAQN